MRVGIAIPSGNMVHAKFAFDLSNMFAYIARNRRDITCMAFNEEGSLLEVSRHRLVINAIGHKCDYILWIDTDMRFSYDTLSRLVDSGKDVIGCLALLRQPPHASNTYDFEDKQVLYDCGMKEVKYIGTGCLLTKTEVFEKIGVPYFKVNYNMEQTKWWGEDLDFCDRVRAAGYKIWVHGELSKNIKHIGSKEYGYEPPSGNLS